MPVKLGINIDHVATLRQARGFDMPDPVAAARVCLDSGADMIVVHLRQDRRHIQEQDVRRLRKEIGGYIHMEMAAAPEIVKLALSIKPDSVCLVPESSEEKTTQGGLKLLGKAGLEVEKATSKLLKAGIGVSYFVDPDAHAIRTAHKMGADTVELCTKAYAEAHGKIKQREELESLEVASFMVKEIGLHLHSGHGLDYHNVAAVAGIDGMECLNIGFSVISRALFVGLGNAVAEMREVIS